MARNIYAIPDGEGNGLQNSLHGFESHYGFGRMAELVDAANYYFAIMVLHLKLYHGGILGRKKLEPRNVTCKICKKVYLYDRARRGGHSASSCNSCNVTKHRRNKKLKAIAYKGGSCAKCGYNKCPDALEFHHIDPKNKEFTISRIGAMYSWERVKAELDKCELVCANCHRELEACKI